MDREEPVYAINSFTDLRWDALREQVARLEVSRGALLTYNGIEEHDRLSAAIEHLEVAILWDLNIYLHLMGPGHEVNHTIGPTTGWSVRCSQRPAVPSGSRVTTFEMIDRLTPRRFWMSAQPSNATWAVSCSMRPGCTTTRKGTFMSEGFEMYRELLALNEEMETFYGGRSLTLWSQMTHADILELVTIFRGHPRLLQDDGTFATMLMVALKAIAVGVADPQAIAVAMIDLTRSQFLANGLDFTLEELLRDEIAEADEAELLIMVAEDRAERQQKRG